MRQTRRHRMNARQRRKKTLRRMILCLFFLIIIAIILFICKFKGASDTDKQQDAKKTVDISVNTSSNDQENHVVEEPTETEKQDVRTVKNTATQEHHKTNGLSICMYHYVYDKNNPPEEINNNFIEVHALEEELKYLAENEYYFPTWEEVRQFVDGELLLPEKSVVLTFDDGAKSFLELGAPLFDKYKIPVTSFLITSKDGEKKVSKYESDFVTFQSHSDNMHRGGGNIGHGGIFPVMEHTEAIADLKKSIDICKNGDAFAYPYGDYTDSCVEAVKDAGFICAVTTEYGRTNPGDNPLLLPRVRMLEGQSLESFIKLVE